MTSMNNQQWEGFLKHSGVWYGLQSIQYHADSEDSKTNEKLLCGTSLCPDTKFSTMNHTIFYVDGANVLESNSDEILSEKIVKKSIALYKESDSLVSKVCANCLLGGPASTKGYY